MMTFKHIILLISAVSMLSACSSIPNQASEKELYGRAHALLKDENFNSAEAEYNEIEIRFPFGDFSRQIKLDLMYAQLMQGKSDNVIYSANRFVRLNPDHNALDYVYYVRAMAHFNKIGKGGLFSPEPEEKSIAPLETAFNSFASLHAHPDFSESVYLPQTKAYMQQIRSQIALYHLNIGQYYIDKKAWIAVAGRAELVLNKLPGSIHTKTALEMAVLAYSELGNNDKAAVFEAYLSEL
jgi:outer membrane protein assembly factor BamD